MPHLNWAVIGLGGAGRGHAHRIDHAEGMALAAGCDPSPEAREAFAGTFGAPACEQVSELLAMDWVDGVTVAAPSQLHARLAIQALEAGKHVLVEKPFALNAAEAERMVAAARSAECVVAPFHNRRFDPDFLLVREALEVGCLGPIRRIHSFVGGPSPMTGWRTRRDRAGGSTTGGRICSTRSSA